MEYPHQFITVLDELARRFGVAVDWTQQNVMPYVIDLFSRIVMYRLTMASIAMGIALTFMVGVAIYIKRGSRKAPFFEWEARRDTSGFKNGTFRTIIAIVLMVVAVSAALPVFLVNLVTFVRCIFLLEMVVFDFVTRLVSGS